MPFKLSNVKFFAGTKSFHFFQKRIVTTRQRVQNKKINSTFLCAGLLHENIKQISKSM